MQAAAAVTAPCSLPHQAELHKVLWSSPALPAPGKRGRPQMGQATGTYLRAAMPAFSSLGVLHCRPCRSPVVHQGSFYVTLVVTAVQCGISQAKIVATICALDYVYFWFWKHPTHLCFLSGHHHTFPNRRESRWLWPRNPRTLLPFFPYSFRRENRKHALSHPIKPNNGKSFKTTTTW